MAAEFDNQYRVWKTWHSAPFGSFSRSESLYFEGELKAAGLIQVRNLNILELGFGNGSFAGWAKSKNANYHGVEAIPELVDEACRAGYRAFNGATPQAAQLSEATLDLIVAFDVFEHVSLMDLMPLLADVRKHLKPNGVLIFRIPSADSPFSGAIQHGDLTHKTMLGSSAVRQLAQQTGFEVASIREPVMPWYGLGFSQAFRRLLVIIGRQALYPLIRLLLMDGGAPILSPNMVVVFRNHA